MGRSERRLRLCLHICSSIFGGWVFVQVMTAPAWKTSPASKEVINNRTTFMKLEYNLVENTTLVNSYGDSCRGLRYAAVTQDLPVTVHQWAKLLIENEQCLETFTNVLKNAPINAFFFETKGVTRSTATMKTFEFVLIDSSYLYQFADNKQDPHTFGEHFANCADDTEGCVFPNLGKDSILIAPKPIVVSTENNVYGHLAAFHRRAPSHQIAKVWKLALHTYLQRLESVQPNPVWLSTEGTGVAWTHLRLDPIPKFYGYQPFADGTDQFLENAGV